QQEINLHQPTLKRKPTKNKHPKTIENKPKHRRVENHEKTPKNQHKTRNNNQNQQKIIKNSPKNIKTGSVAPPYSKQNSKKRN
ncbi:hypothetical protein ACMZ7X_05510, partial [Gardnerella swidsinskii]|uniref:hypothetical protein n=1 Tax=Gardnerella swidsinskii TaxID=2792979 RepID=UPI0039EEFC6A